MMKPKKIKLKKPEKTAYTQNQWDYAEAYWYGDAETLGNAFKSYLKAYPGVSEGTARAHAFDKIKERGVVLAHKEMEQKYNYELMNRITSNEKIVTAEDILVKLSDMVNNVPHEITGKRPYKESTQFKACALMLKVLNVEKGNNTNTFTNVEIHINEAQKKADKMIKEAIDITDFGDNSNLNEIIKEHDDKIVEAEFGEKIEQII